MEPGLMESPRQVMEIQVWCPPVISAYQIYDWQLFYSLQLFLHFLNGIFGNTKDNFDGIQLINFYFYG